jgi:hypothetical protein
MEQIGTDGERFPADPAMIARYDQMEAKFSDLTSMFLGMRAAIKGAAMAGDTETIAEITKQMDAVVKQEWPNADSSEINYMMFLIHLVEQARLWTERNFDTLDIVIRQLAAISRPGHPLHTLPTFGQEALDEELAAVQDLMETFHDEDYLAPSENSFTTDTGVTLYNVHQPGKCVGTFCVVHNPAPGPWGTWDTHWRDDWRLMVRICPHDVHHVAVEEMLRMPLLGLIAHEHPQVCDCACDLSRCEATFGEDAQITGFFAAADGMPGPCQPIGCDNGYHLPGCPYEQTDATDSQ